MRSNTDMPNHGCCTLGLVPQEVSVLPLLVWCGWYCATFTCEGPFILVVTIGNGHVGVFGRVCPFPVTWYRPLPLRHGRNSCWCTVVLGSMFLEGSNRPCHH